MDRLRIRARKVVGSFAMIGSEFQLEAGSRATPKALSPFPFMHFRIVVGDQSGRASGRDKLLDLHAIGIARGAILSIVGDGISFIGHGWRGK